MNEENFQEGEEVRIRTAEEVIPAQKKIRDLNKISRFILLALVLVLPLWILPFSGFPLDFNKSFLAFSAVIVSFLLWIGYVLQNGTIRLPKSLLLLVFCGLVLVWLFSSIFSLNRNLSLIGAGSEVGTLAGLGFSGLAMFLVSILFRSQKDILRFFYFLFLSIFLVFVLQALQTFFDLSFFPGIFRDKTSNFIGGWNELAIFFGFGIITATVVLAGFKKGKARFLIILALISSLAGMVLVNFSAGWYVLGAFLVVYLAYLFSILKSGRNFLRLPLVLLALTIFFVLGQSLTADLNTRLGISFIEIRPSWSSTFVVIKETVKVHPLLGSGPNTFIYNWLQFKPPSINNTAFWQTRFEKGIGLVPSFFAETGILGILFLAGFLGVFLLYGLKAILYSEEETARALLLSSFLGALYLWIFAIIYSSGFFLFFLAFLMTGIFLSQLLKAKRLVAFEFNFSQSPVSGFLFTLLFIFVFIAGASSLYLFSQKYVSAIFFDQGLKIFNKEGNLDKAEQKIIQAGRFDKQDRYFRALAELGVLRLGQIVNQQDVPPEILRTQFQNTLAATIQNAQKATEINPGNSLNWLDLGKVYEAILPFNIPGAGQAAGDAYTKAFENSPLDPSVLLAAARVAIQIQDFGQAQELLAKATGLKSDYAPAHFLISQLEARAGNIEKAIQSSEQTFLLAPNDIGVLFQLGLLYYQNKDYQNAKPVFERAVSINPSYSNARYFLGLIYDREGKKDEAISQFEKIAELNPGNQEVERIIENLQVGKSALFGISPPEPEPQSRKNLPIEENAPNL
ncbi:MAG: hypothetical protein UU71_C0003G0003 [Parcubacteria group bacterium GW2011_GWB1_41_6]|nr:MAG: hypothetical protein UU71_C0003G0003 [Parcubacteria group bacterium GW2011_GWB1_41_6]KKS34708.1 MAG: hypothetical protein UU96_C0001G0063 [Parcubacteria group bacterium GW2011_GWC2_42_13]KKS58296.1 MAG: hypothetical protein UV22_C0001G0003 [Parcubacteria group bacterium GW2011_GWA2_42_35]